MKNVLKAPVVISGAGLCGSLLALRLAQRGIRSILLEKRPDMRTQHVDAGRSINLALSNRGIRALREAGMDHIMLTNSIPMHGRMVHLLDQSPPLLQAYSGRSGEYINSISRQGLNMRLLDAAEKTGLVEVFFEHPVTSVDLEAGTVTIFSEEYQEELLIEGEVIFGTDGVGSIVRKMFIQHSSITGYQESMDLLNYGYKELEIPAGEGGHYQMEKNALHIWPRGHFMMIALPNLDITYTVTLFLPFTGEHSFDSLKTPEQLHAFFQQFFPDALLMMPDLHTDFFQNPTGNLGTLKCTPWQYAGKVCLLGDAAHAVVPFYGQGMNASFEDVRLLDAYIQQYGTDWKQILPEFVMHRKPDTDAIADLAVENFYEMRDHVANPVFQRKRKLETQLEMLYPDYFSKYSMVTFRDDMHYRDAMRKGRAQDALLMQLCAEELPDPNKVYQQCQQIINS